MAVGVGSWLWMLQQVVLDAHANNQTVGEALLEWHRDGDAHY